MSQWRGTLESFGIGSGVVGDRAMRRDQIVANWIPFDSTFSNGTRSAGLRAGYSGVGVPLPASLQDSAARALILQLEEEPEAGAREAVDV